MVDTALQLAKTKVFEGIEESEGNLPDWTRFVEQYFECYKIDGAKYEEDEA